MAHGFALVAELINFFFSVVTVASAAYWLQGSCDRPLAPLLLVLGVVFMISTALTLVVQVSGAESSLVKGLRPFYVRFGLLAAAVVVVWLLLSNIFVFSSATCAQTSAARPFWGSTLYNFSWWTTVVADVCIGLAMLCCGNELWAQIDRYRDYLEEQQYAEVNASAAAAGGEADTLNRGTV